MPLVKLSKEDHRTLKIDTKKALLKYTEKQIIDINIAEVGQCACCFPIIILPGPQGALSLTILTSLESGHNVFAGKEEWQAIYLPQSMQTSPFYLRRDEDRPSHYDLGFDDTDPALSEEHGDPIFDPRTAKPSIHVSQVEAILKANVPNLVHTARFIEMLKTHDLLKPIELVVTYADNTSRKIAGVITIDEDKLHDLPTEALLEFRARGYLLPMHAMLTSLYQVNALIRLHNLGCEASSSERIQKVSFQLARQEPGSQS